MGLFTKKKDAPAKLAPVTPIAPFGGFVDYGSPRGLRIHLPKSGGVRLIEPPVHGVFPRSIVERGRREGWIETTGGNLEYLHTGPTDDPTSSVDAVEHFTHITFHTLDGDLTYFIEQNPGRGDRSYHGRAM